MRKRWRGEHAKPSAADHNQQAEWLRGRARPANAPAASGGAARQTVRDVLVRNDTGAALPMHSVVQLGDVLETSTAGVLSVTFAGLVPGSGTGQNFAVLRQPLAAGQIGAAASSGVATVRVRGASGRFADMDNGSTSGLRTFANGFDEGHADVVYRAPSDAQLSVVRLGNGTSRTFVYGVLTVSAYQFVRYETLADAYAGISTGTFSSEPDIAFPTPTFRPGELVAVDVSTNPALPIVYKLFSLASSYDIEPGRIGIMLNLPAAEGSSWEARTRQIVDAVELIGEWANGTDTAARWCRFSLPGWGGGIGAFSIRRSSPVLLQSGWLLGTVQAIYTDRASAFVASSGTIGSITNSQGDSCSLSLTGTLFSEHSLNVAEGTSATPSTIVSWVDATFPGGSVDSTTYVTSLAGLVRLVCGSSNAAAVNSQDWKVSNLWPGLIAALPTVPYWAVDSILGGDEHVCLGYWAALLTGQGDLQSGLTAAQTAEFPGINVLRLMPTTGGAGGLYALLPQSGFMQDLLNPGQSQSLPVSLVVPEVTVA